MLWPRRIVIASLLPCHSFLYYLAPAMRPRMLMTLDAEGALLPTPVRVGQAVDVVAQAGRPKAITGAPRWLSGRRRLAMSRDMMHLSLAAVIS